MCPRNSICRIVAVVACWSFVVPTSVLASDSAGPARPAVLGLVNDVELGAGGLLVGQLVGADGVPSIKKIRLVDSQGRLVASTLPDREGRFVMRGLRAGMYQLGTEQVVLPCRIWAPGTAPPAAQQRVLLVDDPLIARGQRPIGDLLFSPPVLWSLVIAAAIVIPIAIHNSRDAS